MGTEADLIGKALLGVSAAALISWITLIAGNHAGAQAIPPEANLAWAGLAAWSLTGAMVTLTVDRRNRTDP